MNEATRNWTWPGDPGTSIGSADGWSFMWDPVLGLVIYIIVGYLLSLLIRKLGGFSSLKDLPKRESAGRTLGIIAGMGLCGSCIAKTVSILVPGSLPMVHKFTEWGIMWMIPMIYTVELIGAFGLFYKKYFKLGVWFSVFNCVGAVVTHLPDHADGPYWASSSGGLLILTLIGALLYAPEMYPKAITKLFGIEYNAEPKE
nr:hypothetical protein [uncultured Marinifilum sp.]